MSNYEINQQINLPQSDYLPIVKLHKIFGNRRNSYKFLFFLGLINYLEKNRFQSTIIVVENVYKEMLSLAWYPSQFYKLNFGKQDKIPDILNKISIIEPDLKGSYWQQKDQLEKILSKYIPEIMQLNKYVKYRLIRPFVSDKDLVGIDDETVNNLIKERSIDYNKFKPLYFIPDDETIVIYPEWLGYIKTNIEILRAFIMWEWLEYMTRNNPFASNIQTKLAPPPSRDTLSKELVLCAHSGENCHLFRTKVATSSTSLNLLIFLNPGGNLQSRFSPVFLPKRVAFQLYPV